MKVHAFRICLIGITARDFIDTKEQILKKAKRLFAKYGFEGVSIRKICEKATCNVSAISYHYGSKEELYRACLAEDDSNIINLLDSILVSPENEADFIVKLRLFMHQFFDYMVNNRELILIVSKDVNSKQAMECISKISQKIPEKIRSFFQEAIAKGILSSTVDPTVLGDFVTHSYFMHTLFADLSKSTLQINVTDPEFRSHYIDQQINLISSLLVSKSR